MSCRFKWTSSIDVWIRPEGAGGQSGVNHGDVRVVYFLKIPANSESLKIALNKIESLSDNEY